VRLEERRDDLAEGVGKNRRDSLRTYSRCSSVEMIDA
jgi:hypothetical protein